MPGLKTYMKCIVGRFGGIGRLIGIYIFLCTLDVSVSLARNVQAKEEKSRSNIIFILTDDQRWNALGAMGNTYIQTPHLDSLANAGVLFQNMYVTTSICCASRASIFTGEYESRNGIDNFRQNFTRAQAEQTYPALLKDAGYETAFVGKFGVGTKAPGYIFNYFVDTEAGGLMQPNYIITDSKGQKIHDTDYITRHVLYFLEHVAKKTQPFCLSISYKAPHVQDGNPPKYIIQARYRNLYKNEIIPMPVTDKPKYWDLMPPFFKTPQDVGHKRWKPLFSPKNYEKNVKDYYRLITGVDHSVGKIVNELKRLGLAKNTVIIFTSDNGEFMGAHELEGKWWGYQESIRVPLFISDPMLPDKIKHSRPEEIALNIDIAPTILSLAHVAVADSMQGMNLIAMLEDKIPPRKDFFYQHYFWGSPRIPKEEGVVTTRFVYMKYIEHGYEELFDTKYDPHEIDNLAGNPKYKKILDEMRRRYEVLKQEVR